MIYMTTDEWNEIFKLIEEHDYYTLAEEIVTRTCNLDISKQVLDGIIRDYEVNKQFDKQNNYYL